MSLRKLALSEMPYHFALQYSDVRLFYERVPPTHFPEHHHPEIEISFFFEGVSCLSTRHNDIGKTNVRQARAGEVSILPGNQPHSGHWHQDGDVLILYLHEHYLDRLREDAPGGHRSELVGSFGASDALLWQLGLALRAEAQHPLNISRLYVEAAATLVATQLLRAYSSVRNTPSAIRLGINPLVIQNIADYIQDHLAEDLSLIHLAQVGGFSPSHFLRLFKQATGTTPHQYLVQVRVQRAKTLLLTTSHTVDDIAKRVGFTHASHLTYHFRRTFGVPPNALREEPGE